MSSWTKGPDEQAGVVVLPDGAVVCRDCGQAVVPDSLYAAKRSVETVEARGRWIMVGGPAGIPHLQDKYPIRLRLTRCDDCLKRRLRAEALAADHQRAAGPLGGRRYQIDMLEACLVVFEVLGTEAGLETDRDVKMALEHLSHAGSSAFWSGRLLPTVQLGVDENACASSRWSHLDDSARQVLRDAYGAFLRAKTDRPVAVTPPEDDTGYRGCLLCGVGTIMVLSSKAETAWGRIRRARTETLGGPGTPDGVLGYLCPVCRKATEQVGALGPTAMEHALLAHLNISGSLIDRYEGQGDYGMGMTIDGLKAWCTLVEGTTPNAEPWQHLRGLGELAERLRKV